MSASAPYRLAFASGNLPATKTGIGYKYRYRFRRFDGSVKHCLSASRYPYFTFIFKHE